MNQENLKELTSEAFERIWKSDSEVIKYQFGLHLFEYAAGKFFDYNSTLLPAEADARQEVIDSYRKTKRSSSIAKQFHRLSIGYYGVRNLSPKKCNLISENALNSNNTTNDHIIGVTTCSQYVLKIFKEKLISNLKVPENDDPFKHVNNLKDVKNSIDELCNTWLFDHLWLWAQCKITVREHDVHNLKRVYIGKVDGIKTIEDEVKYKFNLEHYKNATITITSFKNN